MKTNQSMMVRIGDYTQPIEHLTMMGHLNSLWDYGNGLRAAKGLSRLDMNDYLRSPSTAELIMSIEKTYTTVNPHSMEFDSQGRLKMNKGLRCVRTKMGKGGGTWVQLYLLLDAAAWLDSDFRLSMYETFVKSQILQWRDESGDQYNNLAAHIDAYLPERELKLDNKGIIINIAKMIRAKVNPENNSWNDATYSQLEYRATIEKRLCDYLQMGMIRNWEHLKEVITKL